MGDSKPPAGLVREVLAHPTEVPQRLATVVVARLVPGAARRVAERGPTADVAEVERRATAIVNDHVRLARLEGGAAGAALSWAEVTSVVGSAGTLTLPVAALGMASDLVALAWIQGRMVLEIALTYGADPGDHEALRRDLLELQTLPGLPRQGEGRAGGGRAGQAIGALLRWVGLRAGRRVLGRLLPLVNVPITATANARATRALGARARALYASRALPSRP